MRRTPAIPTRRWFLSAVGVAAVAGRRAAHAETAPRVISMDYALAETQLAIGAPLLGLAGAADWNVWVVEPPLPPAVIDVGGSQTPNYEFLARLKPDAILTTPYLDAVLGSLQRIAPTVRVAIYEEGVDILPRAIAATRLLGERFGRVEEARLLIARADAEFASLAARVAAIDAPPVLLVSFMDPRHVRIYGGKGLYGGVLDRIGLRNAYAGEPDYWGFATVGIERLAAMGEAHLMSFEPVPPDVLPTLRESPLWRELPFVKAGAVSTLPAALMFGAVPSALRFARLIVAELERAAAA